MQLGGVGFGRACSVEAGHGRAGYLRGALRSATIMVPMLISAQPILCGKLNPAFERCEVGEVLHHLIKTGCIERRTAKIVPLTLVTSWADSRLFITGRFLW